MGDIGRDIQKPAKLLPVTYSLPTCSSTGPCFTRPKPPIPRTTRIAPGEIAWPSILRETAGRAQNRSFLGQKAGGTYVDLSRL